MNQFSELISVLLPVSSFDEYFPIAIDSILNQSYSNFELIVLVNGVDDHEYEKISAVCCSDFRVKLIRLNLRGLVFALNYGLELASGKYIARMDADDISSSDRFLKQIDFFSKNPNFSVVGGRVELIDENGNLLMKKFNFYKTNAEIYNVLPYRNPLCHPGLMFVRQSLIDIGGYKFSFMSEDHELFIRMMRAGYEFFNIDYPVLQYRRHGAQITNSSKSFTHFVEISAFMYMYFMRTLNAKYILGMLVVFPPFRYARNWLRNVISK
ncbi:glycosyltransferase [Deefgea salmonis]|uniref:Glycosyltransferase n=1 Tax=Deefgea salmonis TaxID=2875502 RepID=A0ABS8BK73_9NEIS|nr:glycosyltransferase [Deefgea salmonis]MCB5196114.1 glycosyltransferase [Deefgea salmonis]